MNHKRVRARTKHTGVVLCVGQRSGPTADCRIAGYLIGRIKLQNRLLDPLLQRAAAAETSVPSTVAERCTHNAGTYQTELALLHRDVRRQLLREA